MSSSKSMVELLSNAHSMKSRLSTTILILSIFIFIFLLLSSVVTINDLLTIHERVLINAVVLILSILLFIAIFWNESRGDFFSFINIILWLYFPFFVIPIFAILFLPEVSTRSNYWDMSSFEYAIWIVIFSLYSLCFGYKLAQKIGINISLPFGTKPSIRRIVSYVFISFIALLVIAIIKSHLIHASLLEIIWFKSYASIYTGREYGMGIYTLILFIESFFSYIFYMCLIFPRDDNKNKTLVWGANIFILLYIAYTVTNGIISTHKTGSILIPFFLIAFLHYTRRKVSFKELFILLFIGIFILITFNSLRTPQAIFTLNFSNGVHEYFQSFDSFEHLIMIVSYFSDNHDYYMGHQLFEDIFYLLIPRALWEAKPSVYGFRIILYDINPDFFFSGYMTGLHGQFYADFGTPAVIIGLAIFGIIIKVVYNIFKTNMHKPGVVIIYLFVVSQSWLFLTGGFPWPNVVVMNIVPLFLVFKYTYPYRKKFV